MTLIVTQPALDGGAVEQRAAVPAAHRGAPGKAPASASSQTSESREGEQPVLALRGISKRFRTTRQTTQALDRVTLEVRPREFICIVGPSGCGKSTLLNIAAGIDRDYEGEALFEGSPIRGAARERAVVFQEPALFPWLNVRANVEF